MNLTKEEKNRIVDVRKLCEQAEAYLKEGAFRQAVTLLKPEALRPGAGLQVRSLYGLAAARSDRSFYGFYRGLKRCSEALKHKPDDPYLLVNLGKVYLYHGLRVKAFKYLDRAMDLAPEDPAVREARGLLGFRQRPKLPFLTRENLLNILLGKLSVAVKRLFSGYTRI